MQRSTLSRTIVREFASARQAVPRRGKRASCLSSSTPTFSAIPRPVASSTTWLSGPCSAWDKRSAATYRASAVPSATTSTSDGPAGISIATPDKAASCLAAITYWLPGPKILYTAGMLSVPNVIAATACIPPALNTRDTPHNAAVHNTAGFTLPSGEGGVHNTVSRHPAIAAGTASISTVEKSGALPPGI